MALALTALAGCTEDTFVGDENLKEANGSGAISFDMGTTTVTRAGGSEAATALSNQFIVYGEKDETTDGAAPATGKLVFQNYKVGYNANTAYTTTSNTKDWEYVGLSWTPDESSHITTSTTDAQTIKYWDYGADSYTFTAVSALPADISSGRVSIAKTTAKTDGNKVYDKGYTITLAKTAGSGEDPDVFPTLNKLYFSDREVINKGTGSDRTAENAYGGNVTLTFRNLVSQIRAGIYETIPGYDITEITFYISDGEDEGDALDPTTTHAFGAICQNTKVSNYEGTLTVTYYTNSDGSLENQPKVTASGTQATDLILGDQFKNLTTTLLLGKSATSPTWDTGTTGTFTEVMPQINNSTNLKLTVDYTLWNSVTKETIEVKGATAEIPARYLQWKPNYKYTYLFKISDNTNGHTGDGTDPSGLYPITFDALEVVANDGQAEYITTISEPSITTFGVKSGKYTTEKDEYEAGSDIYVTVVDGSNVVNPALGENINVYLAETANKNTYPITEASVAESLAEISTGTKKITVTNKNADATDCFTAAPAKATEVPSEEGVNLSVEVTLSGDAPTDWVASDANVYYSDAACTQKVTTAYADGKYYKKYDSALKLTGVKAQTVTGGADKAIVVEYVKTAATYNTTSAAYTFADAAAMASEVSSGGPLYSNADGTTLATWEDASSHTYYRRTSLKTAGVYTYKVIKVVAE